MNIYEKFPTFECAHNEQQCHLIKENNEYFVEITPCYKKYFTRLAKIRLDDFEKLNYYDISLAIRNAKIPQNHNFSVDEGCHCNRGICDWRFSPLSRVEVSIQPFCNIKCKFCTAKDGRDDPELMPRIKKLYFKCLNDLKDKGIHISFTTNGEPFLWKKEVFDWLESLTPNTPEHTYNVAVSITSNMTLLDDEDVANLIRLQEEKNMPIYITASVNGTTKEEVEEIQNCKIKDWDAYINRILLLHKHWIVTNINHVFTRENVHKIQSFYDFWKSKVPEIADWRIVPLADTMDEKAVTSSPYWKKFFEKRDATSQNVAWSFYNSEEK